MMTVIALKDFPGKLIENPQKGQTTWNAILYKFRDKYLYETLKKEHREHGNFRRILATSLIY